MEEGGGCAKRTLLFLYVHSPDRERINCMIIERPTQLALLPRLLSNAPEVCKMSESRPFRNIENRHIEKRHAFSLSLTYAHSFLKLPYKLP
jgi:hypothetical protein